MSGCWPELWSPVMSEVGRFRPPQSSGDYVVDIAFRSWDVRDEPEFTGVRAGMVGRKQRRFIIWHSVPAGLDSADSVRASPDQQGLV
jgi:hypothetical protein